MTSWTVCNCSLGPAYLRYLHNSSASFFLAARFSQEDYTYDWYGSFHCAAIEFILTLVVPRMMHFLLQVGAGSYLAPAESDFSPPSQKSALGWSRELETTTRCSQNDLIQPINENDSEDGTLGHDRDGRRECKVPFIRDIGTYS